MKNKKTLTIIAIAAATALALGLSTAAAYDSSEDPLISLSYLKNIFKPELLDEVDDKIEELEARVEDIIRDFDSTEDTDTEEEGETETDTETESETDEETEEIYTPTGEGATSDVYEVIELKLGWSLYAVSACDIMLRSGTAVCIAPDENQGIADYTSAEEIYNGMSLTKNHMCLIPRGDGRGLRATSESVYVMIRGDYTIVE